MNKPFFRLLRGPIIGSSVVLLLTSVIGITWGWAIALAFAIGTILFTACCVIGYYCRSTYHFNNIVDKNQSVFFAFFTNPAPPLSDGPSRNRKLSANSRESTHLRSAPYTLEEEEFVPFRFKPDLEAQEEERIVRAILRQVFSDDKEI